MVRKDQVNPIQCLVMRAIRYCICN